VGWHRGSTWTTWRNSRRRPRWMSSHSYQTTWMRRRRRWGRPWMPRRDNHHYHAMPRRSCLPPSHRRRPWKPWTWRRHRGHYGPRRILPTTHRHQRRTHCLPGRPTSSGHHLDTSFPPPAHTGIGLGDAYIRRSDAGRQRRPVG
jgi:hypothetical protein